MDKTERNAQCRKPNRKTMQSWKARYQETGKSGLVGGHRNLDEESSKALGPYPTRPTFGPAIGWLYLAVVLDVFSRMVVGWPMATIQDATLAVQALLMALARRHPQA